MSQLRTAFRAVEDQVESYANWYGHGQEVIPVLRPDGLVELVPVLGEAR